MLLFEEVQFLFWSFPFKVISRSSYAHILPICLLKYSYSCFFFCFCFLVFVLFLLKLQLLLLSDVISLYLIFLMYSSSPCIDTYMHFLILVSPLPPSFLYKYNLSSLRYKALCRVINFILWFICMSSFHFKNGLKYLTRETNQVFIHLITFLLQSLVLRSFLLLLRS